MAWSRLEASSSHKPVVFMWVSCGTRIRGLHSLKAVTCWVFGFQRPLFAAIHVTMGWFQGEKNGLRSNGTLSQNRSPRSLHQWFSGGHGIVFSGVSSKDPRPQPGPRPGNIWKPSLQRRTNRGRQTSGEAGSWEQRLGNSGEERKDIREFWGSYLEICPEYPTEVEGPYIYIYISGYPRLQVLFTVT